MRGIEALRRLVELFAPIEKALLQNVSLPAADADWLETPLEPAHIPTTFRIQADVSVIGLLKATITNGGDTRVSALNSNGSLEAGTLYIFDILVHQGDKVNLRYSATGGTINLLRIQEIPRGT